MASATAAATPAKARTLLATLLPDSDDTGKETFDALEPLLEKLTPHTEAMAEMAARAARLSAFAKPEPAPKKPYAPHSARPVSSGRGF